MSFGTKIRNGWFITKTSVRFALNNKQILAFALLPIPLFLTTIFFFLFICLTAFLLLDGITHSQQSAQNARLLIAAIVSINGIVCIGILSSISLFFRSALSTYVAHTLRHESITISRALKKIRPRLGTIIQYAALSTALGIVLNIIARQKKHKSIGNRILASLLHTTIQVSWSLLTFFMVPIVALEKTNMIESLKLSGQTFKKTWGESLSGSFSISGIMFLSSIVYGIGLWILSSLLVLIIGPALTSFLLLIAILLFIALNTAVSVIFQTILYLYATEGITGPFDQKFLAHSFVTEDQSKK